MTPSKRKAPEADTADASKPPSTKTINFTSRNPPWTYLKLQLIPQPNTTVTTPLDPLTAKTYLTAALSQFLGLTGTSISIDILKISSESEQKGNSERIVWIRVPRQDASAVVAALSSWIGGANNTKSEAGGSVAWRVCAKGNYLGALANGSGNDLFVP